MGQIMPKRTPIEITPKAFFAEPRHPRQRQYEALRAYFLEGLPSSEVARRFGYHPGAFRILCWRFRHKKENDFFQERKSGPKAQPKKSAVWERVVELRKRNFSAYDIRDELERAGKGKLSTTGIQEI